ncbi:MAG: alkaline shock response membrane anchor protein AmaP [Opitutales bacterium]
MNQDEANAQLSETAEQIAEAAPAEGAAAVMATTESAEEATSGPTAWEGFLDWLTVQWERLMAASHEPWFWPVVGGIVALVILVLFYRRYRKSRRPLELFTNSAGKVLVSRKALGEVVRSVAHSVSGDSRPKVKFRSKRGQLYVELNVHLRGGQKLSEMSARLQDRTVSTLRESLGLEKVHVNVVAVGFSPDLPRNGTTTLVPENADKPQAQEKPAQPQKTDKAENELEPADSKKESEPLKAATGESTPKPPGGTSAEERRHVPPGERTFTKPAFREPTIKEKPVLSPPGKETAPIRPSVPEER